MKIVIDEIVKEWSKRIPSGIIDLKNENHLYILSQVLEQSIDDHKASHEIMLNIREQTREDY